MAEALPSFDLATGGAAALALLRTMTDRPIAPVPRPIVDRSSLASVVATLALEAHLGVESVEVHDDELDHLLEAGVPFLFMPRPARGAPLAAVYAILPGGRQTSRLLLPADGERSTIVPHARIRAELGARPVTDALGPLHERIRERSRIAPGSGPDRRLERALRAELRGSTPLGNAFVFREKPATSIGALVRKLGLGRVISRVVVYSVIQSLLVTLGWAVIGSLAIAGHAERGTLVGWALLSVTGAFVQMAATRFVGRFTIRAATTLREHLLDGALRLEPDDLGAFGFGGLMVVASQADAFLNTVIVLFVGLLGLSSNLAAAVAILWIAPLPAANLVLFGVFLVGTLATLPALARRTREVLDSRVGLTTDMVERMLGHRTRLVQQSASGWHDGEDEAALGYVTRAEVLDRQTVLLRSLPRAYYATAIVILFFVLITHPTQEALALAIGGMTLGMASLMSAEDLVLAAANLHALWAAIRPVTQGREERPALTDADTKTARPARPSEASEAPIVELRAVRFAYPGRAAPVLEGVELAVRDGDRVLLEGRSGGGKTTLASLLSGLRIPDAGLVLVRGLDHHTIDEGTLRRTIGAAPQFYKNHVFAQSLAFNLLLGRGWPPSEEDLRDAGRTMRALGLGPLLEKMPAGLFQFVGEMGWQLSHGEKSRVYLARTLLQRSDMLVLDETFGALDPATLEECMKVVLARAKTVVVITHR